MFVLFSFADSAELLIGFVIWNEIVIDEALLIENKELECLDCQVGTSVREVGL